MRVLGAGNSAPFAKGHDFAAAEVNVASNTRQPTGFCAAWRVQNIRPKGRGAERRRVLNLNDMSKVICEKIRAVFWLRPQPRCR